MAKRAAGAAKAKSSTKPKGAKTKENRVKKEKPKTTTAKDAYGVISNNAETSPENRERLLGILEAAGGQWKANALKRAGENRAKAKTEKAQAILAQEQSKLRLAKNLFRLGFNIGKAVVKEGVRLAKVAEDRAVVVASQINEKIEKHLDE